MKRSFSVHVLFWLVFSLPLLSWAAQPVLAPGTVPALTAQLPPLERLNGAKRLNLALSLPVSKPALLDQLLQQLYDPTSPSYRQWLTPEQLAEQFGAAPQDYQAVLDWAKAHNLAVTATHPNRLVLDVAGAVADIEQALHVTLRVYQHPTEARTFYAPDTIPSLDLAVPVLSVAGLDDYSLPRPMSHVRILNPGSSVTPQSGTGPSGTYAGCDFRAAYLPGSALNGTGQTVGLLQFDGYYPSDITAYETQFGLPNVPLTNVPIDGGVTTPGANNAEVCLDIEMVLAMAPGVSRIYVYEAPNPSPWIDLLSRMQTDNLSKQLSCSWSGGGPDASSETIFKLMAAQGQSFFNATGDSDAFTSSIPFPADSTNITQVGGTTLTTSGPCGSYTSETVWNWGGGTGSSGGISTYYGIPSYQLGINMSANQGSTTLRNVPDVALTADNIYVRYNNGGAGTFGGTSCAAPLWAGFTALANQQAVTVGRTTVGFLNPTLYLIGQGPNYATSFHDITTGNNTSSSSPSRFYATTGYDLCTGWGTPRGTNLVNVLAGPPVLLPLLVSNSFTLLAENCPNGAIDPGETVTVTLGLKNIGTANTTNLVATMRSSGGIVFPSGPQTYGVLLPGGAGLALPFTFSATGNCGDTNTATLQLQDETANLGTVTFSFRLGALSAALFTQNFDGVTAPALPSGWATSASGAEFPWVTTTTSFDTSPNAAFSAEPGMPGVNELDTPTISLPAVASQLTFRHNYALESTFDGGVLEIAIGGGAWTDILAAGGTFASGGYTGVLSTRYQNPLAGRQAWTGVSGGFITTTVNMPASAAGQSVKLRWRCGTDIGVSGSGWYVDSVALAGTTYTCCTPPPLFRSFTLSGNQLSLTWTTVAGRNYQLQYASTLPAGSWSVLTTLTAGGSLATTTDTISASSRRFYRVVLMP